LLGPAIGPWIIHPKLIGRYRVKTTKSTHNVSFAIDGEALGPVGCANVGLGHWSALFPGLCHWIISPCLVHQPSAPIGPPINDISLAIQKKTRHAMPAGCWKWRTIGPRISLWIVYQHLGGGKIIDPTKYIALSIMGESVSI